MSKPTPDEIRLAKHHAEAALASLRDAKHFLRSADRVTEQYLRDALQTAVSLVNDLSALARESR